MSDDDKRKSDREPVTLFVEYEGADDLVGDYTENLSSGGTFVATNRELPIGTNVHLVLSFPGLLEPISIEGTVRWTRGSTRKSPRVSPSLPTRITTKPGRRFTARTARCATASRMAPRVQLPVGCFPSRRAC